MPPVLPADAVERAREIADSAPRVSDAKLARLKLLLNGSQAEPFTAAGPAEAA